MFKCHLYTDVRITYLRRNHWGRSNLVKLMELMPLMWFFFLENLRGLFFNHDEICTISVFLLQTVSVGVV